MTLLGAHMSVAGGIHLAPARGREVGCDAIQVFTKNERQWKAKELTDGDCASFKKAMAESKIREAFAHDSYLINLASPKPDMFQKSLDAFVHELERCEALGLTLLVTHPGSPGEEGEAVGIENMRKGLNEAVARTKGYKTLIALETTAGQGHTVGRTFEQMRAILDGVKQPDRVVFCFDTCHVFASGYDIRTQAAWDETMGKFDAAVGTAKIRAFHVNDSKKELGCRVDRHENIGKGCIGVEAFRCLMNDERFAEVPMVIETPKEDDMDPVNLGLLRSLVRKPAKQRA
jgi:deoxyribonuclease-4